MGNPAGTSRCCTGWRRPRAEHIPRATRPDAVLVDLACGGGLMAPHAAALGYRHVGLDLNLLAAGPPPSTGCSRSARRSRRCCWPTPRRRRGGGRDPGARRGRSRGAGRMRPAAEARWHAGHRRDRSHPAGSADRRRALRADPTERLPASTTLPSSSTGSDCWPPPTGWVWISGWSGSALGPGRRGLAPGPSPGRADEAGADERGPLRLRAQTSEGDSPRSVVLSCRWTRAPAPPRPCERRRRHRGGPALPATIEQDDARERVLRPPP